MTTHSAAALAAGDGLLLWLAWAASLLPLCRRAAWAPLREAGRFNLWCAAIAVTFTLWCIRYTLQPGLSLHLLGATVLTLMFGPWLALAALNLVAVAAAVTGISTAAGYPALVLLAGVVPVAVSAGILRAAERWLPPNLFVFIFVAGFFGGALAKAVQALATAALFALYGGVATTGVLDYYLPYALLLAWGEAFMTGMIVALMVAWYPQWISLFDDRRYLARRRN
ncbi:MAG: energy-coupling factor ABC transporter permease [Betaproteobacteria bacterium]|nr:energy-coupling factor ABC transporter permease [Betaproteobacteria bacterium]